jgi:hypothetical protein
MGERIVLSKDESNSFKNIMYGNTFPLLKGGQGD